VPKEVKSQPLAEKKAPGKKPTGGLGAPPSGPPSTVDSYERQLLSIPEFANFGKLFKVLSLNLTKILYIRIILSISDLITCILILYIIFLTSPQHLWSLLKQRQNMQLMLLNTFLIHMLCFSTTAQTQYPNNYWKM